MVLLGRLGLGFGSVVLSLVLARYLYASPTWWSLPECKIVKKVEGLLHHTQAGFCSKDLPNFSDICLEAVQNLFRKVLHNPEHVLQQLLPPPSFCLYPQLFSENMRSQNFLIACLI